jgi:serine/threonine-protein kinase
MAALLRDEPSPLQTSPSLEKIVRRCIAKQPSGRYQTMSEVKKALEQVFGEKATGASAEPQPSIAVLPFADMSPGKDNEWFGDGLAEEIINALAQIPGLKVTARTSAFAFRGKEQDIRRIAETLNVCTILEGSVRKSGSRIRVTVQLINAADGYHLWSQRYDREMAEVFAVQDEIAAAIAEALKVKLGAEPATSPRRYMPNLPAYEAYLKARYHWGKYRPESLARSKEYLEQAIALDPKFALAHCGYADHFLTRASCRRTRRCPRYVKRLGRRWRSIPRYPRHMPCWGSWLLFMTTTGRKLIGVSIWRWRTTLSRPGFTNGMVSFICCLWAGWKKP